MIQAKILLGLVYILLLIACQSAPPVAVVPEPAVVAEAVPEPVPAPEPAAPVPISSDAILATRDGFSPLASSPANTISFELRWAQSSPDTEWAVTFASPQGVVRTIRETGTVPSLTWDGRDDEGNLVTQDHYWATLALLDNGVLVEKAASMNFLVDIAPPTGTITVDPLPFRPGEPGAQVTMKLEITPGGAPWTLWRMAVLHPDGRRFRDFISEENRDDEVVWDGRAVNNATLEPGTAYRIEAEVFDVYGNRGVLVGGLSVLPPAAVAEPNNKPLQVSVVMDGKLLAALPVWFGPNTADLNGVDADRKASNESSLEQLSRLLKTVPSTKVTVVGHANQVLYEVPEKAAYEQSETLIPLSLARAEAVRNALLILGLSAETLEVKGVGASDPLVPFDDAENRWKNRRVVIESEAP